MTGMTDGASGFCGIVIRRMTGDGRVICVDAVLAPIGDTAGTPAKLLDCNMMVFISGKERTKVQWDELYQAAGFKIHTITFLPETTSVPVSSRARKNSAGFRSSLSRTTPTAPYIALIARVKIPIYPRSPVGGNNEYSVDPAA